MIEEFLCEICEQNQAIYDSGTNLPSEREDTKEEPWMILCKKCFYKHSNGQFLSLKDLGWIND